jgi:hypothetical protein
VLIARLNDGAVCSEGNEFRVKFDFCSELSVKYHMHRLNSLNLFNIHKLYVLPTQCVSVFCMDHRTKIISLYNINRTGFMRVRKTA